VNGAAGPASARWRVKSSPATQLFDRIRHLGVRKSDAKKIVKAVKDSPKKAPKPAQKAIADPEGAVAEVRSRIQRGSQARSASAQNAATTRKSNAAKRSMAANKAAPEPLRSA